MAMEYLAAQQYDLAVTILLMPESRISCWEFIAPEQSQAIALASVANITSELSRQQYKRAAHKFLAAIGNIKEITPILTADFWYGIGKALTIINAFDLALTCYSTLEKMEHTYLDVEQKRENVLNLKAKYEKSKNEKKEENDKNSIYKNNLSLVLFEGVGSTANSISPVVNGNF